MVRRIDAFAHAFPRQLHTELEEKRHLPGLELMKSPRFWDVEHRLSDMDEFDIDEQLIMLGRTGVWDAFRPDEALSLVRSGNDAIRQMADDAPDRLTPVGTLPLLSDPYVEELERCIEVLGLAGVQIPSNIRGEPLDAFPAFFERAAQLDTTVWIHPHTHPYYDWIEEYANHKTFGWLCETSLAQSRLVYSGIMDRHPDLHIVVHHMGGMVPFFPERIVDFYDSYSDETWPDLSKPALEYFQRFHGDTVLNGASKTLHCGIDFYGTDGTVFATDYPFGPEKGRKWMRDIPKAVDELAVDETTRERIYCENVSDLVD